MDGLDCVLVIEKRNMLADSLNSHSKIVQTYFQPALFSGVTGDIISAREAEGYCAFRRRRHGSKAKFSTEGELLDLLEAESVGPLLILEAEAGAGKSSFIRFTFDFFRHFRDEVTLNPQIDSKSDKWKDFAYDPLLDPWFVIHVSLPRSTDKHRATAIVLESIWDQTLKRFPEIRHEGDDAFMKCHLRLTSSRRLNEYEEEALKENLKKAYSEQAGVMFALSAIRYIVEGRMPELDRKRVVLVLDDTDFVAHDVAVAIVEELESFARGLSSGRSTRCVVLAAVRPDTSRQRFSYLKEQTGVLKFKIGPVDFERMVRRTTKSLKQHLVRSLTDVPWTQKIEDGSILYAPVPREFGLKASNRVLGAAVSLGSDPTARNTLALRFLHPLVGDSCRRFKWFYERISSNPAIYSLAVIRPGTRFSYYDVLQAVISGSDPTGAGITDQCGVGFWWGDIKGGSDWRNLLGGWFVISMISTGRIRNANALEGFADTVGVDSGLWINRLAEYAYVDRPSGDGDFGSRPAVQNALWALVTEPAYVDVVAALRHARAPLRVVSENVDAVSRRIRETFDDAAKLIVLLEQAESDWRDWFRSNRERRDFDTLGQVPLFWLSKIVRAKYRMRLQGLASAERFEGHHVKELAMAAIERFEFSAQADRFEVLVSDIF